jgi:hypothetical protein
MFGRTACFATLGYGQPLQKFPLTSSTKYTGRCATGSQSMNAILSMLQEMFTIMPIMTDGEVQENPPHGLHAQ